MIRSCVLEKDKLVILHSFMDLSMDARIRSDGEVMQCREYMEQRIRIRI